MLTQERLKEVLHYYPETGIWTWLISETHRIHVGDRAGGIKEKGYRTIGIDGKRYRSARLAVLYMTGKWPKDDFTGDFAARPNSSSLTGFPAFA